MNNNSLMFVVNSKEAYASKDEVTVTTLDLQKTMHDGKTIYAIDSVTKIPYVGNRMMDFYEFIPALADDATEGTLVDLKGFLKSIEKMIPLITATIPDDLPRFNESVAYMVEKFTETFPGYMIEDYKIIQKN